MKRIIDMIFLVICVFILLQNLDNAFAYDMAIPSAASIVELADTIVRGYFVLNENNAYFQVESVLKGNLIAGQTIPVSYVEKDMWFNLVDYIKRLETKSQYIILGQMQNNVVILPWLNFSIWPVDLNVPSNAMLTTIDSSEAFALSIIEYAEIGRNVKDRLTEKLFCDISEKKKKTAVLCYLSSDKSIFKENINDELDILSIVAVRIISEHPTDDFTVDYLLNIASSLPPSIALPYFIEVANEREDKLGEIAVSRAKNFIKGYKPSENEMLLDIEDLSKAAKGILPRLQIMDAKKYMRLFDSESKQISNNASLVLQAIFSESMPVFGNIEEEKAYWSKKIAEIGEQK